jgi:hypothetical protein
MEVIREVHADDWCVRLDLSGQVLRLEIPEIIASYKDEPAPPLLPCLPRNENEPVSAATLLLKAKQFDDGLYAAVEMAAQHGLGRFPGKASLLRSLASTLATWDVGAAATVYAACELGGIAVPDALKKPVRSIVTGFLDDQLLSKPLGFYTWSEPLKAIFRQDRLLQQPLKQGPANYLERALKETPGASESYDACLRLNARLTNPPARPGLGDPTGPRAFFPASCSHEQLLFERLFGDKPVPDGFDLMRELIRRVRSGEITLKPTEQSGWYDHQTWSLAPLILPDRVPETAHLQLGMRYRGHLEDLFRGALALTRETHVKQLAVAVGGCRGPWPPPIWVTPNLSVEPLPTCYERRASSYRFVRAVLEETFGADALMEMHRLTPEGPSDVHLGEELAVMEKLFDGASATARQELGMAPLGDGDAVACFAKWRGDLSRDRDASRDARMMVPVYYDLQRKQTKVWAFLGWRRVPVVASFEKEPLIVSIETSKPEDRLNVLRKKFRNEPEKPLPSVRFERDRYEFAVPVMAEVYVERLLDRDEFRKHCDRFRTRDAILANLR